MASSRDQIGEILEAVSRIVRSSGAPASGAPKEAPSQQNAPDARRPTSDARQVSSFVGQCQCRGSGLAIALHRVFLCMLSVILSCHCSTSCLIGRVGKIYVSSIMDFLYLLHGT